MNFLKPFLVEDHEASSPEESSLTFPESSFSGGLCHLQRLIPCLNATSSNAHGGSAEAATISTASEFNYPAIQDLDDDAVTRKVRGTEKEIWVGRIHSIGTDLQDTGVSHNRWRQITSPCKFKPIGSKPPNLCEVVYSLNASKWQRGGHSQYNFIYNRMNNMNLSCDGDRKGIQWLIIV